MDIKDLNPTFLYRLFSTQTQKVLLCDIIRSLSMNCLLISSLKLEVIGHFTLNDLIH